MFSRLKNKNHVLVIVGPSGVGKSFLIKKLSQELPFKLVLSTTTRPMRSGEINGVDMEFVNEEELLEIEKSGDIFMDNSFLASRYVYRRSSVENIKKQGLIPAAIVYSPIVDQFYAEYPDSFGIFLYPTNLDLLAQRMKNRGESEESIQRRLQACEKEIHDYETTGKKYLKICIEISEDEDINNAVATIKEHYGLNTNL